MLLFIEHDVCVQHSMALGVYRCMAHGDPDCDHGGYCFVNNQGTFGTAHAQRTRERACHFQEVFVAALTSKSAFKTEGFLAEAGKNIFQPLVDMARGCSDPLFH